MDPRGIGESATDKTGWVFAVSLLLGENFVGRQAWDLGRVLEALGAPGAFRQARRPLRPGRGRLPRGHVRDRPGVRRRGPLRWYLLRDGFLSFRAFLDRPKSLPASYRLLPETVTGPPRSIARSPSFFAFDALRSFDLPQLLATSRGQGPDRQPTGRGPGTSPGGGRPQPPPAARPGRLRGRARAKGRGFLHEVLGPG